MNGRELGVAAETGPWPRDNAAPASLNPLAFRPPALPVNGADRRRCGLIVVHRLPFGQAVEASDQRVRSECRA